MLFPTLWLLRGVVNWQLGLGSILLKVISLRNESEFSLEAAIVRTFVKVFCFINFLFSVFVYVYFLVVYDMLCVDL